MRDFVLQRLLQEMRDRLAELLEEQCGEDPRLMFTAGFVAGAIDEGLAAVREDRRLRIEGRDEDLARLLLAAIEEALAREDFDPLRYLAPIARKLLGGEALTSSSP